MASRRHRPFRRHTLLGQDKLRRLSFETIEAWNERDFERYYSHFAADLRFYGPHGIALVGPNSVRQIYDAFLEKIPDFKIQPVTVVADADERTLASLQMEEGHVAATGQLFRARGMTFFRVNDEYQITEMHESFEIIENGGLSL